MEIWRFALSQTIKFPLHYAVSSRGWELEWLESYVLPYVNRTRVKKYFYLHVSINHLLWRVVMKTNCQFVSMMWFSIVTDSKN